MSSILVIGTLDTKGEEYKFLLDRIHQKGHQTITIDVGILEDSPSIADFSSSQVVEKAGHSLADLRSKGDRGHALDIVTIGLRETVQELVSQGKVDGCVGMGGGGGTAVIASAMQELAIGTPKLILSTVASGDVSPYVGVKDVTMMYSVVDIAGLNRISTSIIANAANAICGMCAKDDASALGDARSKKKLIAATMFGVTTACVTKARAIIEEAGHEVIVFHATGSGGRSMEALIESNYFDAVLDATTTEWCDELVGGVLSAGPNRLEAAGKIGVPQVVSLGALDMVNFWAVDTIPLEFQSRTLHKHNANVTLMRTTPDEAEKLGRIIAQKLSRSTGPTELFIPLKGISELDKMDGPFEYPEANARLFEAIREHVGDNLKLIEIDCHINDPEFAEAMAAALLAQIS